MSGVLLLISGILELPVTLQALWEPPGLQMDAPGDLLASLPLLGNFAHTLVNSVHSGSLLGLKNLIPDSGSVLAKSVSALGRFMCLGL